MTEANEVPTVSDISAPSKEQIIEQILLHLKLVVPRIEILRPGEFCEKDGFLNDLPIATVEYIARVVELPPSVFQAGVLSQKSESELMKSVRRNTSSGLDSSIALGSLALKYMHKDDPNRGIIISLFGRALRWLWELHKKENDGDLDDVIYYFQKTVELEPEDEENRALHFDDLGCALWERYMRHRRENDFEDSRSAFEAAVNTPHSGKPMFLSNLGRLYKDKALYSSDGKEALMKKSLEVHLEAVSCVTPGFLASIRSLHRNLAISYLELYTVRLKGTPTVQFEPEVEECVNTSGYRWMFLYEIAVILTEQFRISGDQGEADVAIAMLREALTSSTDQKVAQVGLADILEQKGISIGSISMITEAREVAEKALEAVNEYSADFLTVSLNTTVLLTRQFILLGDAQAIGKAISVTRRAINSPYIGERLWKFQQILGIQLNYRFETSENTNDLEEAISSIKAAIDTTSDDLSLHDRGENLGNYGRILFNRFIALQNQDDLDNAMKSIYESIEIFGPDNSAITDSYNDLANCLLVKFERTGQVKHVHAAIEYYLKAVKASDHFPLLKATKPVYYNGLGNAFLTKYQMWDQAADLSQAIAFYEDAVRNTHPSDNRRSSRIGSLCRALFHQFQVTSDKRNLLKTREYLEETLAGLPALNSQHISYLYNILGLSYLVEDDASSHNTECALLDKSIESFTLAASSGCTLPNYIYPPNINLIKVLSQKFTRSKNDTDFMRAAQQLMKIHSLINLQTTNRREFVGFGEAIGDFVVAIYDEKKIPQFGLMALSLYTLLAKDQIGLPDRQLYVLLQCARLIYEVKNNPDAARQVLARAVQLLPEAIVLGPNRSDQLRFAKKISFLPSLLITLSLAAGDHPVEALKLYDRSRSLIWNRLIDSKSDLSDLRTVDDSLASKFEHLRVVLNQTSGQVVITEESANQRLKHHNLYNEYQETLQQIRKIEGFRDFLLLHEEPFHLAHLAAQGPVIILNATPYRGDAIMLTSEGVVTVPLPNFVNEECIKNGAEMIIALDMVHSEPHIAYSKFDEVMKWLWEIAARPVLDKLGIIGEKNNNGSLPRIWWVFNRWESILPIHAAGDHKRARETGEACTVVDRTVSSYVSTLRALEFVRTSALALDTPKANAKALLVKMPTTPDDVELAHVAEEVSSVQQLLDPLLEVTNLDGPKRKDVVPILQQASVAHFACHGISDPIDPSLSKLKFQDWKSNPFNVRFLMRNSFKGLGLVYLSACETFSTKDLKLADEGIHISSAFQMAGVPYTVASAWKVEDAVSLQIARDFYTSLVAFGNGELRLETSAEALHAATLKSRNSGVETLLWGAMVHSGA